jgi:aryl-alcohol dehydrogenase-like predicted oxidoreductase
MKQVSLGLGLLSIGRTWGVRNVPAPSLEVAEQVISTAYEEGIRFFDTAPAYRYSEEILGIVLSKSSAMRETSIVATKVGEHWDFQFERSYPDHRYDALTRSFDESLKKLGNIDIIQIHKADTENVISKDTERFLKYAFSCGVKKAGASVSNTEVAKIVCQCGLYQYIQFPYNAENRSLESVFSWLDQYQIKPLVNRPFAMGGLLSDSVPYSKEMLFDFILEKHFNGVILTGTSSVDHLLENVMAFKKSVGKCG